MSECLRNKKHQTYLSLPCWSHQHISITAATILCLSPLNKHKNVTFAAKEKQTNNNNIKDTPRCHSFPLAGDDTSGKKSLLHSFFSPSFSFRTPSSIPALQAVFLSVFFSMPSPPASPAYCPFTPCILLSSFSSSPILMAHHERLADQEDPVVLLNYTILNNNSGCSGHGYQRQHRHTLYFFLSLKSFSPVSGSSLSPLTNATICQNEQTD